ncbi:MAG: hypothetical protein JO036_00895 [Candidatus Eremiobacteraeota bacterium]|nr:hypothetical protein [Candidatus Eremiobacteraeota bacterium]
MMRRRIVVTAALAAFGFGSGAAFAQTPNAQRAAELATKKAKQFIYQLTARGSGLTMGTVTLQKIGGTRTRIRIDLANPARTEPTVTLRSGSDCQHPIIANAPHSPILLNPFTGRTSTTVVNLPLTAVSSGDYLVHVQNATARAQAIDACAHLR